MNLRTLKKAILIFLLLMIGVFLVSTYFTDIIPILGESWGLLHKNQIQYFSLEFLMHLISIYLFAIHWQQVIYFIGFNTEAACLYPTIFEKMAVNNLTLASMAVGDMLLILWFNKRLGKSYNNAFRSILSERSIEEISILILSIYVSYSLSPLFIKLLPLRNSTTQSSTYLLIFIFFITGIKVWFPRSIFTFSLICVQLILRQLKKSFTFTTLLSFGGWILDKVNLKMIVLAPKIPLFLNIVSTISISYLLIRSLLISHSVLEIFEGNIISIFLFLGLTLVSEGNFFFLECFELLWTQQLKKILHRFNYGGF